MAKAELLAHLDLLRTTYISILNEKDVLLNWRKPQLIAIYSTKIGIYQVQRLQLQLQIMALKRKLELINSAIAQNLYADINGIELFVAQELEKTERNILQQVQEIEEGKMLLANLSTPQKSSELRKVFNQLAKQLHPDVNPDFTDAQLNLWHLVKAAYETGDVEQLKSLQLAYQEDLSVTDEQIKQLSEEELSTRVEILNQGIQAINKEIEKIRASFPFDIEEQILDDDWVAGEVSLLEIEIDQLEIYKSGLLEEYALLKNTYGGTKPELN